MTRIAHCCCGSLRAETTGEPAFAAACHCMECQRRTGAPFGVSTYFAKEQVRTKGPSKIYVRGSDSGREIEQHFCPNCGSTVLWYSEVVPDGIGIAFGAFAPFDALAEVLRVGDGAASLGDLRSRTRSLCASTRADRGPCDSPLVSARAKAATPPGSGSSSAAWIPVGSSRPPSGETCPVTFETHSP